MILSWDDKDVRKACEDSRSAIEKYGLEVARSLQNRISDLMSIETIFDLPVGNPKPLDIEQSKYLVGLARGYNLILLPNHVNIKYDASGKVDWHKVKRIKIQDITNNPNCYG